MKVANICLVLFLCLIFSINSLAARFWVATVSSNWNNTANWSAASGGVSGASVPGIGDDVNFDNGGLGNCTIDATVSVKSITVAALYTGTISQGANTISSVNSASFSGGSFIGGNANITIGGFFTLSGTAFTSTSAVLELDNNTVAFTSGVFTHNNGTVRLNFAGTQTMTGTSPVFYTLEFVGAGSTYTLSSVGNLTINNSLNLTGSQQLTINAGTIDVKGDINSTNTNTGDGGSAQININGAGAQNFNGSTVSGTGALPQLTINKASGTLSLSNFPAVANNFIYTAGTINAGTSTFCFTRGSINAYNITGSVTLNNISFNMVNVVTATIGAATILTTTGDFTMAGIGNITINTGAINVNGNIFLTNTGGGGGTGTINIVGAGSQNMDGSTIIVNQSRLPIININKSGGTLNLIGNISASANVIYTAGTVNVGTSTFYIVNNLTITGNLILNNLTIQAAGNTTLTVAAGSTVSVAGTFDMECAAKIININTGTIAVQGNIIDNNTNTTGGGSGTILINGAGAQNITSTGIIYQGIFPAVTINKSGGTLTFPALITVRGNWTYTTGTLDVLTNNSTVVFGNSLSISGSHTLNNVDFDGSGNYIFSLAGTTLTASGNMSMTGTATFPNNNITLNGGTINLMGDLSLTNTGGSGGGNTNINFAASVNQNIISLLAVNQCDLPAVTITKPSGTLIFPSLITVRGNWTYVSGTLDVTTNNSTVVLANILTITGSHTLNNVTLEGNFNNTYTLATGTLLTVSGIFSTTGASNVYITTPVNAATAIQAQGNITINNTSVGSGGVATILINGTGSQTFTGNAAAGHGAMPFLSIQKLTGTLTLVGIISESQSWTYGSGTVDATSNSSTVVFGGNNLNITSAGMSFYNVLFTANTSTLANSFSANNNLTISGLSVLAPGANAINLGGNWANWGTLGFNEATSTVNFNGATLQTITTPGGENFTNVIVNNSATGLQLVNAVAIATSLTMTQGNIDLNTNTLSLGTTAVLPGTLNYTSGTMINSGTFSRWFAKTTIAAGGVAGLFPVGTITDYRPFNVSIPVAPTTGGTIAVSYTDATTNTSTSFPDGAATVFVRKDLNWGVTTTTLAGGTYNLGISGTGYGLIGNVSDLRLTLVGSVIGTAGLNAGTVTNPQVNRTGLTQANLNNTFYLGSINSISSPLPVTLISFTATPENGEIKLNWETSAEVNNDHFTIQRSTNSVQWQDIQIVAGSGNTNIDSKYSAYDLNPYIGISYYRLEQTDQDGKYSFSIIRQVILNTATTITIYPNPATDQVYVSSTGNMQVQIFNIAGQQMVVPSEPNGNGMILHVMNLRAGIYFVHILKNGNVQTTNMIIKE